MIELLEYEQKLKDMSGEDFFYEVMGMPSGKLSPYEETQRDYILTELARRLNIESESFRTYWGI